MPKLQNTDSYPRFWPWLQTKDGATLALGPGETADVDVPADQAEALAGDPYLRPVVASTKTSAPAPTSTTPQTEAKE